MDDLCPHGRHLPSDQHDTGAACPKCAEFECRLYDEFHNDYCKHGKKWGYCMDCPEELDEVLNLDSGLNASYYRIPKCISPDPDYMEAQDIIEWMKLSFANGNQFKSQIREYNPDAPKKTNPLYEAEKRYYFAKRHLAEMRRLYGNETTGI